MPRLAWLVCLLATPTSALGIKLPLLQRLRTAVAARRPLHELAHDEAVKLPLFQRVRTTLAAPGARPLAAPARRLPPKLHPAEKVELVQQARTARLRGVSGDADTRVLPGATPEEIQKVFERFDLDGNGELSLTEFLAVMMTAGTRRKAAELLFQRFDANGDGKVTYDEFARSAVEIARRRSIRRRLWGEAFGTAMLVGGGKLALAARTTVGPLGAAAIVGVVVAWAIYATRAISGAHLNPAITAAFVATGSFRLCDAPAYMLSQLAGATAATAAHAALRSVTATGALSSVAALPAMRMEASATFLLVLLVFTVAEAVRRGRLSSMAAPAAIGTAVTGLLIGFSPIGICLNPATSLGGMLVSALAGSPAAFSGAAAAIFGPFLGAMFAIPFVVGLSGISTELLPEPTA